MTATTTTADKSEEKVTTEEKEEPLAVSIEAADLKDLLLEEEFAAKIEKMAPSLEAWEPKTILGKRVRAREIQDIERIFDEGHIILEAEIIDMLLPALDIDLLMVGQSKGKFGGGQKRVFKQTQKKTQEGNKPKFATIAVVGNKAGILGTGYGKAKETVPAREKAVRNAKINVFKIRRGCGSWQCMCKEPHSIPFAVSGKVGSVEITLFPAPKGRGLIANPECQKILRFAGVQDVWSRTRGQTRSKINLIEACVQAMRKLMAIKVRAAQCSVLGIAEGKETAGVQI